MVKESELKILTATVTIQLVTVDGKRMTKSVFDQIQTEKCFNYQMNFIGDSLIGYVNNDGWKLLWVKNGQLRKSNVSALRWMSEKELENKEWSSHSYELQRLQELIIRDYKSLTIDTEHVKDKQDLQTLKNMVTSAKDWVQKLDGSQLYISI